MCFHELRHHHTIVYLQYLAQFEHEYLEIIRVNINKITVIPHGYRCRYPDIIRTTEC